MLSCELEACHPPTLGNRIPATHTLLLRPHASPVIGGAPPDARLPARAALLCSSCNSGQLSLCPRHGPQWPLALLRGSQPPLWLHPDTGCHCCMPLVALVRSPRATRLPLVLLGGHTAIPVLILKDSSVLVPAGFAPHMPADFAPHKPAGFAPHKPAGFAPHTRRRWLPFHSPPCHLVLSLVAHILQPAQESDGRQAGAARGT